MITKRDVELAIAHIRQTCPAEFAILQQADREYSDFRRAYAVDVLKKVAAATGERIGPQFARHAQAAWMRLEALTDNFFWRDRQ
jgi:hypothetical protein